MRYIGLDVHRDFCEVAISEGGGVRAAGRVRTTPEALALFAGSLAGRSTRARWPDSGDDEVTLEATGNALAIARISPYRASFVTWLACCGGGSVNRPTVMRRDGTRTRDRLARKGYEKLTGNV